MTRIGRPLGEAPSLLPPSAPSEVPISGPGHLLHIFLIKGLFHTGCFSSEEVYEGRERANRERNGAIACVRSSCFGLVPEKGKKGKKVQKALLSFFQHSSGVTHLDLFLCFLVTSDFVFTQIYQLHTPHHLLSLCSYTSILKTVCKRPLIPPVSLSPEDLEYTS